MNRLYTVLLLTSLLLVFYLSIVAETQIENILDDQEKLVSKLNGMSNETTLLQKKTFSDKIRLVFIAGLEGTGHHGLNSMFQICVKKRLCKPEVEITQKIMSFKRLENQLHGLFGAVDVETSLHIADEIQKRMNELSNSTETQLYFLGLGFVKFSGMLSYPNYNGAYKTLDHPDAFTLAQLAEAAGIDFRVVVLQRNAMEILASDMDHREHGGRLEPKILINNAADLYSQLKLLDKRFFHCLNYRDIGLLGKEKKEELQNFLHPKNIPVVIDEMISQISYTGSHTDTYSSVNELKGIALFKYLNRKYHANQLQARLDLIQELCENPVQ